MPPETPGSINEGGELGYSLAHAYGAVFDNPYVIACCVVGDGEAETGTLATSWHSNKFLNPARDGIASGASSEWLQDRRSHHSWANVDSELESLFETVTTMHFVGAMSHAMHRRMASTLDGTRANSSRANLARNDHQMVRPALTNDHIALTQRDGPTQQ
jgi:xylulose-5-phosphate/fructose-6-phosphate phosphoketolase